MQPDDDSKDSKKAYVHETDIFQFTNGDEFGFLGKKELSEYMHAAEYLSETQEPFLPTANKFEIFSSEQTILNAKSKLGERNYHLFHNNCEHFATWCKTGIPFSFQVELLKKSLQKLSESESGQLVMSVIGSF